MGGFPLLYSPELSALSSLSASIRHAHKAQLSTEGSHLHTLNGVFVE